MSRANTYMSNRRIFDLTILATPYPQDRGAMVEILCIGIQRLVPVAIASRLSGLSDFQRSPPNATTLSVSDFQNLRSFPHIYVREMPTRESKLL